MRSEVGLPEEWTAEAGQPQDIGGVDGRGELGQTGQELRGGNAVKLQPFLTKFQAQLRHCALGTGSACLLPE